MSTEGHIKTILLKIKDIINANKDLNQSFLPTQLFGYWHHWWLNVTLLSLLIKKLSKSFIYPDMCFSRLRLREHHSDQPTSILSCFCTLMKPTTQKNPLQVTRCVLEQKHWVTYWQQIIGLCQICLNHSAWCTASLPELTVHELCLMSWLLQNSADQGKTTEMCLLRNYCWV